MNVAINGFGRIGRNFLRSVCADPKVLSKIKIAAINIGPARIDMVAHMFKYDTILGIYPGDVELRGTTLYIDNHEIALVAESDIEKIPWRTLGIDWVVDCSGRATKRAQAQKHLDAGARYVLISAPAHDEDIAIVMGVNDELFNAQKHHIVSLGSCTTNALIPTLKVLHDAYTVQHGFMTTVHAYTNTQVLLDVETDDLRRSRAAALNIIPTTTGAMDVLGKVMPELGPHFSGLSLRVPVAKVSLLDVTCTVKKTASVDDINKLFEHASSQKPLQGIVGITNEQLVSSDFSGDPRSVVIDAQLTGVQGTSVKVCGWYDNEWAYSVRMKDFLYKNSYKN